MSDQLLVVLRVCLLALVYLVFLRVLRAVWVELRAEQGLAPAESARRTQAPSPRAVAPSVAPVRSGSAPTSVPRARLVLVAPASFAGQAFALEAETTIGRAPGCGVSIDDAHVSKVHARVFLREGSWLVEDLGSTNGTELDGVPLDGPTAISAGSRIRIGELELELT